MCRGLTRGKPVPRHTHLHLFIANTFFVAHQGWIDIKDRQKNQCSRSRNPPGTGSSGCQDQHLTQAVHLYQDPSFDLVTLMGNSIATACVPMTAPLFLRDHATKGRSSFARHLYCTNFRLPSTFYFRFYDQLIAHIKSVQMLIPITGKNKSYDLLVHLVYIKMLQHIYAIQKYIDAVSTLLSQSHSLNASQHAGLALWNEFVTYNFN